MVRISDIFKKITEKTKSTEASKSEPESLEKKDKISLPEEKTETILDSKKIEVTPPTLSKEKTMDTSEATSEVMISKIVKEEVKKVAFQESEKIYDDLYTFKKNILTQKEPLNIEKLSSIIERAIGQLILDNQDLLFIAFNKDTDDENYLFTHAVNICLLSIQMGLGLGYSRKQLLELAIAGFLHDIGMASYLKIVNHPRKLTSQEYEQIKQHTLLGKDILKDLGNDAKVYLRVAEEHHERLDGSGYPYGRQSEDLHAYSKIIILLDVYEAMTHSRPQRKYYSPSEAIKELIENKNKFDPNLIKVLLERIGMYPVGSLVKLSTKEIAQVIKINPISCMRPVVRIIYDAQGQSLREEKILDLMREPTIYILEGLGKDVYGLSLRG